MRRTTKQRELILENLQNRTDHPSADQLYMDLRKSLPRISLGTVYRNLDILVQDGVIQKLDYQNGARYDADVESHGHFRCLVCGKVEDIPVGDHLANTKKLEQWESDRRVNGWHVEAFGTCPECLGKENA